MKTAEGLVCLRVALSTPFFAPASGIASLNLPFCPFLLILPPLLTYFKIRNISERISCDLQKSHLGLRFKFENGPKRQSRIEFQNRLDPLFSIFYFLFVCKGFNLLPLLFSLFLPYWRSFNVWQLWYALKLSLI